MLPIDVAEGERIMKNKKKAALAVTSVVVFLAACGISSEQSVSSGEMVAPEVSSQDILIGSLEYLLLDDTRENVQDTEQQDLQEQEPEMQDSVNVPKESEDVSEEQEEQTEEEIIEGEAAVIYYGNGASSSLNQETVVIEEITPEELISALAMHNIVSLDTKVLAFDQGEQDGTSMLYLDLSKSAGGYLQTMSKEAECIIVASVINTFLENYGADAICLTVEGEPLGTSHTEYAEPIGRCTPEELMEMLESSGNK